MAHDVFISYSSHDKQIADAICAALESEHIRCWIAPRDILPGTDYPKAIIEALNQSKLFVLVFSSNANRSKQVMREIERAASKELIFIPFRTEDVTPSKQI